MPPPPQAPQKPAGRLRSLRLRRASLHLLPVLGPRCRRGPPPRRRCPRPGLVQEAWGPPAKLLPVPVPLLLPVRWTMWEHGVVRQRWSRRRSKRRKHPRLTGRSLRDRRRRRRWHGMSLLVLTSGRHWQLSSKCWWTSPLAYSDSSHKRAVYGGVRPDSGRSHEWNSSMYHWQCKCNYGGGR